MVGSKERADNPMEDQLQANKECQSMVMISAKWIETIDNKLDILVRLEERQVAQNDVINNFNKRIDSIEIISARRIESLETRIRSSEVSIGRLDPDETERRINKLEALQAGQNVQSNNNEFITRTIVGLVFSVISGTLVFLFKG